MARLLSGKIVREALQKDIIQRIKSLSKPPVLAIVQVGNRVDSTAFIRAKMTFGKKIGVETKHIHLSDSVSDSDVINAINELNSDESITGVILQLPLPKNLDSKKLINAIDPRKDADALTAARIKEWSGENSSAVANFPAILPATARGIREMLSYYNITLAGKHVVVMGRSDLVGKPIAEMCRKQGAKVSVCHSETKEPHTLTKSADVLIVAIGRPRLIDSSYVSPNQIVIDVGINGDDTSRMVGDVDFDDVNVLVDAITPVPGGVGPMTVFALFENVVDLAVV